MTLYFSGHHCNLHVEWTLFFQDCKNENRHVQANVFQEKHAAKINTYHAFELFSTRNRDKAF